MAECSHTRVRPALSIIMPFYNGHRFLAATLQSLKDQTTDDFELIVVNDGSTHRRSLEALAALRLDPWARVLDCEHRGLPTTRNTGALAARSEQIMFLDADDLLDPGAIEKLCWFGAIHPDLAFVYSGVTHFGKSSGTTFEEFDPERLHRENYLTATCVMRRSIFLELGGNDPSLTDTWEDYDFWLRLVDRGYAGKLFPEALFLYRRHAWGNSKTLRRRAGNDGAALSPELLARHARSCSFDPKASRVPSSSANNPRCPDLPNLFSRKRWASQKPSIMCLVQDLASDGPEENYRRILRELDYYVVLVICDSSPGNLASNRSRHADETYFLAHMGDKSQQQAFLKYLMMAKAIDVVINPNTMPAIDSARYSSEVRFKDWPELPDGSSTQDVRERLQRELKPVLDSVDRAQRLIDYQMEIIARPVLS